MFVFQIRHINCISKLSPRRKVLKQLTNLQTLEAAYNLEDAKQEQDTCDKANKEIYTAGTRTSSITSSTSTGKIWNKIKAIEGKANYVECPLTLNVVII